MLRRPRAATLPGGFTLIEVLVALAIMAIALAAGLRASGAIVNQSQRETDVLVARLCAENELVRVRLARQLPGVGDSSFACEQAGREFTGTLSVRPTPNPGFRRVDAQVADGTRPVLRLSTIVGRY